METKISIEQAEKEWTDFLEEKDSRSLLPSDDDEKEEKTSKRISFEKMTKAISKGFVVIEDGIITQKLKYPIESKDGEMILDRLVFDKRITPTDRDAAFKGMDTKETSQLFIVQRRFCSKLSGIDMAILSKIDMDDFKITDIIVSVFFM